MQRKEMTDMTPRYYVKTIYYYGPDAEAWVVWERVERREVSWISDDRREMAAKALLLNYAAQRGAVAS
jgi:hypothetical protein